MTAEKWLRRWLPMRQWRCEYEIDNQVSLSYLAMNNRVFSKNNDLSWCRYHERRCHRAGHLAVQFHATTAAAVA